MKRLSQIKDENKPNGLIKIFIKEILKFNKAHNIVGRFSEEEIVSSDILDCETILEHINSSQKVLDIGSGAGLPGLVIAINQPKTQITMSEKNKKKAYFIRKMIRTLQLTNATILDKATTPNLITENKFDVITARALATAPTIIKMSHHLLNKGGKFVLMKGALEKINEEVAQLDNNKYSYTIHKTNISNTNRHILEINKK
ncbi:16S rRNA (guanine(527)-N(7))-methyltransferase RsmG [Gammaproteobacteria bacterium]|nr:16S rRNA (guanine(527)-N(7))-methyltransferase RsmG [Gammaproteobacteria bacterium]MDC1130986.1 16S rRNA (guanine(527)-N(7))-methyltransferase RsmG [Gammaproteobacteria bacterium]MDC3271519.1 16S rRNA (guanine(527)-N(7))-methyltransferase RsmG [Gammaproteobacteria bacterium]